MKKLVVLVAGLLSVPLFAQAEETQNTKENTFSMKVQIRPRAEYRNGVLFPRPKDAESTGFINNRARFSLGYERDRLSIGLSAQHVLSAMMQNMSIELASKGIRVNAVLPGMTETPLIHNDDITQEQLNKDMELYPLKRYADPREIAWAIIYLLSDASTFTIGASLVVDGGFTIL